MRDEEAGQGSKEQQEETKRARRSASFGESEDGKSSSPEERKRSKPHSERESERGSNDDGAAPWARRAGEYRDREERSRGSFQRSSETRGRSWDADGEKKTWPSRGEGGRERDSGWQGRGQVERDGEWRSRGNDRSRSSAGGDKRWNAWISDGTLVKDAFFRKEGEEASSERPADALVRFEPSGEEVRVLHPTRKEMKDFHITLNDQKRKREDIVRVDGLLLWKTALQSGWRPDVILCSNAFLSENEALLKPHLHKLRVDEEWKVRNLMAFPRLEPIVALGTYSRPVFEEDTKRSLVLFCQDPSNMGSIIRTAVGHGVNNIILMPNTPDPFNPIVLRSSAGTAFSARYGSVSSMKKVG